MVSVGSRAEGWKGRSYLVGASQDLHRHEGSLQPQRNKGRVLVTKLTFMNTAGIINMSADPHKMPVGQEEGARRAHMQGTPGGMGTFKHLLLNNSNHVLFNPTSGRPPMCSWHPHTGFSVFSCSLHPSFPLLFDQQICKMLILQGFFHFSLK